MLLLINCNSPQATTANKPINPEPVLSAIAPDLLVELDLECVTCRTPRPVPIHDKNNVYRGIDSAATAKLHVEHKQKMADIAAKDSSVLLALVDTCMRVDWEALKQNQFFDNRMVEQVYHELEQHSHTSYQWKIDAIQFTEQYEIQARTNIQKNYGSVLEIRDRFFGGVVHLSNLYLTKNQTAGFMLLDLYLSPVELNRYLLTVRKEKQGWELAELLVIQVIKP